MPLDKKSLTFLHYLQTAYRLDEDSLQILTHHLPRWTEAYKKIYLSLLDQIKKEKAKSKALKSSLLLLSEELYIRLSDQLTESDLLKILTEAIVLSTILKEEAWQKLLDHAQLSPLNTAIQHLTLSGEKSALSSLKQIHEEIRTHLPDPLQPIVWQYLHAVQQHNTGYPLLAAEATAQLMSVSNYLLKRKLGLSLNDQDLHILWLNTRENHWAQVLPGLLEPDFAQKALTERIVNCQVNLLDYGLAYQSHHQQSQQTSHLGAQLYWQDPLNTLEQGIQTSLFSSVNEKERISSKLQSHGFSLIVLDMRQPQHPYRYARRTGQSLDPQIVSVYQNVNIQQLSVDTRDRVMHWSLQKIGDQGMILAIFPRTLLEEDESQSFREYLAQTFQEIYVLDIQDKDAGLALLYLVKKSVSRKQQAILQYTTVSLVALNRDSKLDFEALKWQKVPANQQSYWIGLPESDFFDLYPIYDRDQGQFKQHINGIASFLDDWLMDDDPKMLEKKVKLFLKQYGKASQKQTEDNNDIKWPETIRKLAQSGLSLTYDKQKIKKLQLKPFVYVFIYAEEKLMLHADALMPSMGYDAAGKQVFPLVYPWHTRLFDRLYAFPLKSTAGEKAEENISDAALSHFRAHYKLRTKNLDQTFIVFPPENISTILDKIESVSRDLPVIRKYPDQINRLLEEARHFTSDIELLTPPYEKIDEFRQKVLRLEKDAIERKVIYQRVKTYIEELKAQLASLTLEHDNAKKDYDAVTKENIFYYTYAVLHHPDYRQKYQAFLDRELPRVPLFPKFRQWVQWGKSIFHAHQADTASEKPAAEIQVKDEEQEKQLSKAFSYEIDQERSVIILKEQNSTITLSNIPPQVWQYQFAGRSPLVHYLDYLSKQTIKNKLIKAQFSQTRLSYKAQIISNLRQLCSLSLQLAAIENEMQKVSS